MLSFAEEIFLLALDDTTGKVYSYSDEISLGYSLVGAILCELSFMKKIDTDLEYLIIMDKAPTGNKALDSILSTIVKAESKIPVSYWLKILLSNANETEDLVLSELINKGILKIIDEKKWCFFHTRHITFVNNKEVNGLKTKIREIVLNESEIPDPREAALVGLIHACNLFKTILSSTELLYTEKRIENLAKFDTIGRKVVDMIIENENFKN